MKAQSAKHNLTSTNELLRFNTHHQIRLNNAVTIGSVSSLIMLLSLNCVGQPQKNWILDLLMVYVKALMYYCEPNVNVISAQQTGVLTINLCKTTLDLHLIIQMPKILQTMAKTKNDPFSSSEILLDWLDFNVNFIQSQIII